MKNLLKLSVLVVSIFAISRAEAGCPSGYYAKGRACIRKGGLLSANNPAGGEVDPSGHGCALDGGYMWCPGSQSCARSCSTGFWSGYNS